MAKGALAALVNAQVAGATTGQLTGPAVLAGQLASPLQAAGTAGASAPAGLLGVSASTLTGSSSGLSSAFAGATAAAIGSGAGYIAPNVGGVLFDRCAEVLTGIGEITGAYWDQAQGAIVLVGKAGAAGAATSLRLPPQDRDLLVVALRAAIAGDPLGISFDAPAELKNQPEKMVDGTDFIVSYLGGTAYTLAGAILFESDRLLKCLTTGVDNETRKERRAHVRGYRPLVDMVQPGQAWAGNWHRFWIVINRIVLARDAASGMLVFKEVKMEVKTELELHGAIPGAALPVDPNDQAFVRHLTEFYDQYAAEFPILARAKELAKVSAIARYLVENNTKLDFESILTIPPQYVATPLTTKAISVTSPNVRVTPLANGTRTETVAICGGVNLRVPPPRIEEDRTGSIRQFRSAAEAARPTPASPIWDFRAGSAPLRAKQISLASVPPSSRLNVEDFRSVGNEFFCVRRRYDAARSAGDFGPGWLLVLPFSLSVCRIGGKRNEVLSPEEARQTDPNPTLVLHDHARNESAIYLPVNGSEKARATQFGRVESFEPPTPSSITASGNGEGRRFRWNPANVINRAPGGFCFERGDARFLFDEEGRLVECRAQSGGKAAFVSCGPNGVCSLKDERGNTLTISRDKAGQVTAISGPGCKLEYAYSSEGRLATRRNGGPETLEYGYDAQGRLSEVRGASGAVSWRAVYDDAGRPVADADVQTAVDGVGSIRRQIKGGRVLTVADERGTTGTLAYGSDASLSSLVLRSPDRREWKLAYSHGRLVSIGCSPSPGAVVLRYEPSSGTLVSAESAAGVTRFEWYADGRLKAVHHGAKSSCAPQRVPTSSSRPDGSTGIDSSVQGGWRPEAPFSGASNLLRKAKGLFRNGSLSRRTDQCPAPQTTAAIRNAGPGAEILKTPSGSVVYDLDEGRLAIRLRLRFF